MARAQQTRTPVAPQRKRVVLITSEKGGVGKSVTARTLVEHLRLGGTRVAAYDADGGVGHGHRHNPARATLQPFVLSRC